MVNVCSTLCIYKLYLTFPLETNSINAMSVKTFSYFVKTYKYIKRFSFSDDVIFIRRMS